MGKAAARRDIENARKNGLPFMKPLRERTMSRDKIEKWDEVNGITAPERNLEAFLESSTDTLA